MKDNLDQRAYEWALYMIETGATVRSTALHFSISKSTVHKTLTQRLPNCDQALYRQVRLVLDKNKAERHLRGGLATREKYAKKAGG